MPQSCWKIYNSRRVVCTQKNRESGDFTLNLKISYGVRISQNYPFPPKPKSHFHHKFRTLFYPFSFLHVADFRGLLLYHFLSSWVYTFQSSQKVCGPSTIFRSEMLSHWRSKKSQRIKKKNGVGGCIPVISKVRWLDENERKLKRQSKKMNSMKKDFYHIRISLFLYFKDSSVEPRYRTMRYATTIGYCTIKGKLATFTTYFRVQNNSWGIMYFPIVLGQLSHIRDVVWSLSQKKKKFRSLWCFF